MTTYNYSDMASPESLDLSLSPYGPQLEQALPNINTIVDGQQQPGESWLDTLQRILPILAATAQQKQILDVQMQRARQGLPPLDASQFGIGVNVGLSPSTLHTIMLGIGALALVLFMRRG